MKRMITIMVAMFLLLPEYLFAQEQVAAPKLKNGDFWDFNVSDQLITSSSTRLRGVYEMLFNNGKWQTFKLEQDQKTPVDGSRGQTLLLFTMLGRGNYLGGKYLQFPLSVGQKWDIEYKIRPTGAREDVSYKGEVAVSGFENVSTTAGNFHVLKLTRDIRSSIGTSTTATYYYSQEAKSIVKMQFEFPDGPQNVELIKFGSGQ